MAKNDSYFGHLLDAVGDRYGFSNDTPWRELTPEQKRVLLYGSGADAVVVKYQNQLGKQRTHETTFEGWSPIWNGVITRPPLRLSGKRSSGI